MDKPDTGIHGITTEHLNNLRKQFDCYYSHIFKGMYDIEELDHKLVNLLLMSVEKDEYLPPKEKVLEYQKQFEDERKVMDGISELLKNKTQT